MTATSSPHRTEVTGQIWVNVSHSEQAAGQVTASHTEQTEVTGHVTVSHTGQLRLGTDQDRSDSVTGLVRLGSLSVTQGSG